MFKRYKRKLEASIRSTITEEITGARDQIAEEAQTAVKQIKDEITPLVVNVTEIFLKGNLTEIKTLSSNNLQMFQTQIGAMNAIHATLNSLMRILEPEIRPEGGDLRKEVSRMAFQYQVQNAFADLMERTGDANTPAPVIEFLRAKIGQLYELATANGWEDLYLAGAQKHTREQMESIDDGG